MALDMVAAVALAAPGGEGGDGEELMLQQLVIVPWCRSCSYWSCKNGGGQNTSGEKRDAGELFEPMQKGAICGS